MYIIKGETDHQPRLDAWDKCSGLVHWEDLEGLSGEGGGKGGSGWETHVNPWLIHVNVWQKPLQYCNSPPTNQKKWKKIKKASDIIWFYMMIICCAQSCPTLCHPMNCRPPGSSVHRVIQARILEWAAVSYSRGSSQPRDQTWVSCASCIGRQVPYQDATEILCCNN